ncbi:MAG: UrcA family protein [Pseudomonadota bacterium]
MRLVVSSLIALGLLGTAQASTVDTIKVEITYNTEAVKTPKGAADVLRTIERKARRDCRYGGAHTAILSGMIDQNCFDDIVNKAVVKINEPMLTSLYEEELQK